MKEKLNMEIKTRNLMILEGKSLMVQEIIQKLLSLQPGMINIINTKGSSNPKVNERTWEEINNDQLLEEPQRLEELGKLPQRAFVRSLGAGDEFVIVDNTEGEIVPKELYDSNRKLFDYQVEIVNVTTLSKNTGNIEKKKRGFFG